MKKYLLLTTTTLTSMLYTYAAYAEPEQVCGWMGCGW
jgi:hypothetical protein